MQYQKVLKRSGHVFTQLLSEDERNALMQNPHTRNAFSFIPVVSVINVAEKIEGSDSAKKSTVPKVKAKENQDEQSINPGVSGPL